MPFDANPDLHGPGSIYPYTTHMINFRSLDGKREWAEYFADIADGIILSREDAISHAFRILSSRIWTEAGSLLVYSLTFKAPDKIDQEVILSIKIENLPPIALPLDFPLQIGSV